MIADPTTHVDGAQGEGMVIQIFRANENDLPMNLYPGRPILFRNLKVSDLLVQVRAPISSLDSSTKKSRATSILSNRMTTTDGHIPIKPVK